MQPNGDANQRDGGATSKPAVRIKARASFVLGLLSVFGCTTILAGIPGLVLGHKALLDIARHDPDSPETWFATRGLFLNYIGTLLFFVVILPLLLTPVLNSHRENVRLDWCARNLVNIKRFALDLYVNEAGAGYYPPLSSEPGRLMMDAISIYPAYLSASNDFVCPGDTRYQDLDHPEDLSVRIDDHSYFYLGYAVTNDEEVLAFAEAHRARMAEGLPFDDDLEVAPGTGSGGGDSLIRLHKDNAQHLAERHESIDAVQWQSRIPILIEHPGNHTPEGGHVLYMDGSVEFIPYPGKWPMTTTTMNLLRTLAER